MEKPSSFGSAGVDKVDGKASSHIVDASTSDLSTTDVQLNRGLKSRHLTMISLGGVLGTGLFLYTGTALSEGGPLGILLAWILMGSMCYAVMICLGEMISACPMPGGAISLAGRYVDESLAFTVGWFYWYSWAIFLPSELSANAVLTNLWSTSINNGVWITVFLVTAVGINLLGSRAYGEVEFWLSYLKIFLIIGLIIVYIVISAGGGPTREKIGFKYWKTPGPFVQYAGISGSLGRFLGFWSTLTRAAFSYIGTEIVAIAAGETKDPRRNVPRAIKNVYIRIVLFYICGVFVMGINVPSNDPRLALNSGSALASPFVIAIQNAGIEVLPQVVNGALLASGLSAANSELFTSSRALHGLAIRGHAPRFHTSKYGVPYRAILTSACFATLAFMTLSEGAGEAFGYLATLGSAGGLLMWLSACMTHIRFERGLRFHNISPLDLPYASRLNRRGAAAKYGAGLISIILLFSGFSVFLKGNWDTGTFLCTYLPVILFPIVYTVHKVWTRSPFVPYKNMRYNEYIPGGDSVIESEAGESRLGLTKWGF